VGLTVCEQHEQILINLRKGGFIERQRVMRIYDETEEPGWKRIEPKMHWWRKSPRNYSVVWAEWNSFSLLNISAEGKKSQEKSLVGQVLAMGLHPLGRVGQRTLILSLIKTIENEEVVK
jgi:hypothetical protein